MEIYIIDVFDRSGKPLQVLTIYPGSITAPDGKVYTAYLVNTKTGTGYSNSYLNGANLMSLADGKPYGTLLGFNFSLAEGTEFSVRYATGTYPAKLRSKPTVADPNPPATQQRPNPAANTQVNPAQFDANQQMIDYVNQMNR